MYHYIIMGQLSVVCGLLHGELRLAECCLHLLQAGMVDGAVLVVLVQRIQCVVDFGEQRCLGEGILAGKSESVVMTVEV